MSKFAPKFDSSAEAFLIEAMENHRRAIGNENNRWLFCIFFIGVAWEHFCKFMLAIRDDKFIYKNCKSGWTVTPDLAYERLKDPEILGLVVLANDETRYTDCIKARNEIAHGMPTFSDLKSEMIFHAVFTLLRNNVRIYGGAKMQNAMNGAAADQILTRQAHIEAEQSRYQETLDPGELTRLCPACKLGLTHSEESADICTHCGDTVWMLNCIECGGRHRYDAIVDSVNTSNYVKEGEAGFGEVRLLDVCSSCMPAVIERLQNGTYFE